jgi:hypothetical protein
MVYFETSDIAQLELLIGQQRYDDIVALLNHQLTRTQKILMPVCFVC